MQSAGYQAHSVDVTLSSDPESGASVSDNGSRMVIAMDPPLMIPSHAKHATLQCVESSIWFTSPNVSVGVNDRFDIVAPGKLWDGESVLETTLGNGQWTPAQVQSDGSLALIPETDANFPENNRWVKATVTIPPGLYDTAALNIAFEREQSQYFGRNSNGVYPVTFTENVATGGIVMDLQLGYTIVNLPATFADFIGYDAGEYGQTTDKVDGATPGIPKWYYNAAYDALPVEIYYIGGNPAKFNNINGWLIHCDLVNEGIRVNDDWSQTIMTVPISVAPGQLNFYQPQNPPVLMARHLIGQSRNIIRAWITDEKNRLIDTAGESFSFRLRLSYLVPTI